MTGKWTWMLLLALSSPPALAAGFEAKTMREGLSAREVERGLKLPKGWLEFSVGADVKDARGEWGPDGEPVDWETARWLYTTERLGVRYGVTSRGELYWLFTTHYVHLTNDALGTDITDFGVGDPHFGYRYEVYRSIAPVTSVVLYGDYKAPLGNEAPGNYVGGPTTFSRVVFSTGTPDAALGLEAKHQVGPVAVTAGVAYVRRFSAIAQWAIETQWNQFSARVKPGDVATADLSLMAQVGPVALEGGARFEYRQAFRYGNTAAGWNPGADLREWAGSEGWALDGFGGAVVDATRGVDVVLGVNVPIRGEDLQFFPLEDVQPTRGTTYSGTVEFRY